ncbi:MAG: hypothetical protein H7331_01920, partial [Bacteroidia bacterium]|nr:hypothetical protein [Bacteroidia bacterium]
GTQAAGKILVSDAAGKAAWKQTIIHGNVAAVGNTSTGLGVYASSGVTVTVPPGEWLISGMGIGTPASCRGNFMLFNNNTNAVVKYTLFPNATGDFQVATLAAYVKVLVTTTFEFKLESRGCGNVQIHSDNNLWDITATGVEY